LKRICASSWAITKNHYRIGMRDFTAGLSRWRSF